MTCPSREAITASRWASTSAVTTSATTRLRYRPCIRRSAQVLFGFANDAGRAEWLQQSEQPAVSGMRQRCLQFCGTQSSTRRVLQRRVLLPGRVSREFQAEAYLDAPGRPQLRWSLPEQLRQPAGLLRLSICRTIRPIPYDVSFPTGIQDHHSRASRRSCSNQGLAWHGAPVGQNTVIRAGVGLFTDLYPGGILSSYDTNFPQVNLFNVPTGTVAFDTLAPGSTAFPTSGVSLVTECNAAFLSNLQ